MKALAAIHRLSSAACAPQPVTFLVSRATRRPEMGGPAFRGGTMTLQLLRRALVCTITVLFVIAVVPPSAWAQHTEGRVNVTVVDPQGAVVPGTELRLVDPASGDTRVGKTTDAGTYSF